MKLRMVLVGLLVGLLAGCSWTVVDSPLGTGRIEIGHDIFVKDLSVEASKTKLKATASTVDSKVNEQFIQELGRFNRNLEALLVFFGIKAAVPLPVPLP